MLLKLNHPSINAKIATDNMFAMDLLNSNKLQPLIGSGGIWELLNFDEIVSVYLFMNEFNSYFIKKPTIF